MDDKLEPKNDDPNKLIKGGQEKDPPLIDRQSVLPPPPTKPKEEE